jgi:two-component system response regulator
MIDNLVEILLVEDNPNDEELILHALRRGKFTNPIGVVRDGAEALDFLFLTGDYTKRSPYNPKLVLLDLKLPKIDGREVLYRIKSHPDTQTIPVVVFTSSREERDMLASYRLGTNSYVVKPIDSDQITEAVQQLGLYWMLRNEPPPVH